MKHFNATTMILNSKHHQFTMKKYLLVILTSIFTSLSIAQISQEVIDKVETYPSSFRLYEQLSNQIIDDFDSDYDRAAAIYTWMATYIRYDTKVFFSGRVQRSANYTYRNEAEKIRKEKELRDELALNTLKKRKAVCQGYSELYRLLCQACGVRCEVVSGYSRTSFSDIGKVRSEPDHAWNAIWVDGKWLFVDATWGAGHVNYEKKQFIAAFTPAYFAVNPAMFSYNHFPEESEWNFTELTLKSFSEQPIIYHTFFGKGIELLSPTAGEIKKNRKGVIKIEFRTDVDGQYTYHYAFHDMKYMKEAEIQKNGEFVTLSIDAGNRRSSYLDIIIDGETVMTYKLQPR